MSGSSMHGLKLTLQASAALTLRVFPSGILDITTYPFVPPTTLSGWLRRVWMLAEGQDLPETSAAKDSPYYVLPRDVVSLGAYPQRKSLIHKTKRKGVKDFKDTSFTRLIFDKKTAPTFQLHTWEYLTTDRLDAFVVCEEAAPLARLHEHLHDDQEILPWGCKLGKEGFAFVIETSEVQTLRREEGRLEPQTLLPLDTVVTQGSPVDFAVHNLYRFDWQAAGEVDNDLGSPSPIAGYDLLPLALAREDTKIETSWWVGRDMRVPVALVDTLGGTP